MSEPIDFMEALGEMSRPKVERKPWMLKTVMERVTPDTLKRVIDECIKAPAYGFDIETTGLDNRVFYSDDGTPYTIDKIAGYCLSPSRDKGYYIPVRHKDPTSGDPYDSNVPLRLVIPELQRLVREAPKAIFHNGKFDHEFLQHEIMGGLGEWDDPEKWEDTLILAYMNDTRERNKGLKFLSGRELSREMIELAELFTPEDLKKHGKDFSLLDPSWEPGIWYACSDAMCTLGLYEIFYAKIIQPDNFGHDQRALYKIEKSCVAATRWMERCRIPINRKKVEELICIGQREWFSCMKDVYEELNKNLGRDTRPRWMKALEGAGDYPKYLAFNPNTVQPSYADARDASKAFVGDENPSLVEKSVSSLTEARKMETVSFPSTYDVTIPNELGLLLRELGVQGLRATEKSGQVKTSKDELERVIDESGDDYPFMPKIRRFREVAKALSSNLFPIWYDTSSERSPDGRIRANFNAHKVDTGRFSTPTPRDDDRFSGQVRWNVHSVPAAYDKKKPECVWRMREIIEVPDGKVLYAIDYSGVELRIVTNLSGEPKWIDEFFRCSDCDTKFDRDKVPPHFCPTCGSDKIGDLHTLTALSIFGQDSKNQPDFKLKRQQSKALNFGMCYGGGGGVAMRTVGVDKEEGWRIKNQYDKTYTGLQRWWKKQHETARKQTYVTTAFGRKYPLPDISHTDGGFRSKAERNSVNGPVQGTSADIMKLAMVLIYREYKKRGWLKRARMLITIHDELVFEVDGDLAEEMVDVTVPLMVERTAKPLGWLVPLKVDIEFGKNWMVPYNLIEMEHGQKEWKPEWAQMFPRRAKIEAKGEAPAPQAQAPAVEKGATVPLSPPMVSSDGVCIHVIYSNRLTFGLIEKLARVINRCDGKGTSPLKVVTESGEVLYENGVKVSPGEFKAIALYEGI